MENNLIKFAQFIYDRQEVWYKRFVLQYPPPWSTDEILNKYKFCNAYRELDKTTKYLINRVINNNEITLQEKVFNILVFRIFNRAGLFDWYFGNILRPFDFETNLYIAELDLVKTKGIPVFNDAYNITQRTFCSEHRKGEKHVQHLLNLSNIASHWGDIFQKIKLSKSAEELFCIIDDLNFFGKFLSYQCLIDISYIKDFLHHDWNSFVDCGPGTLDALKLLSKEKPIDTCKEIYITQKHIFQSLKEQTGKDWMKIKYDTPYNYGPYLSLNNIENCLCEWRKFLNYKNGVGRIKYYKPESALKRTQNPYAAVEDNHKEG